MPKSSVEKFALSVTRGIGSPTSIVIHTVIFVACFLAAFGGFIAWTSMLLVLTTIVSLEAIYLSIFIQMSINYTTEDIEEIQEDIDEIQEDVDDLQEDVEDISEDVEELTEEEKAEEVAEEARKSEQKKTLSDIQSNLTKLMQDINKLQNKS